MAGCCICVLCICLERLEPLRCVFNWGLSTGRQVRIIQFVVLIYRLPDLYARRVVQTDKSHIRKAGRKLQKPQKSDNKYMYK